MASDGPDAGSHDPSRDGGTSAEPTSPVGGGRERITSPLTGARALDPRTVREEIDESSGVGEVYIRSLVRSQLRAALGTVAALLLTVGLLPLAFTFSADLAQTRVLGAPLPWIVLGALVYPGLLVAGWVYVRQAERAEADFADLVERGDRP